MLKKFFTNPIVIVIIVVAISIKCVSLYHRHQQKLADIEAERIEFEEMGRRCELERQEDLRKAQLAVERARYVRDSIEYANRPNYDMDDVEKMVRKKVPSYSIIYLWRKDNDNWIMNYEREIGRKIHKYMRRFNPTKKTFGKEIEVDESSIKRDVYNVYDITAYNCVNKKLGRFISTTYGTLRYEKKGNVEETWNNMNLDIKTISATTRYPSERNYHYEDYGYENAEEYYDDNAEDLRFYYGK